MPVLARRGYDRLFRVASAKRIVGAQVAVVGFMEALIVVAQALLQVEQLFSLLIIEVIHLAELFGEDENFAVGVDDFAVPIGLFQIGSKGHRAMIGEDDRIA